MPDYEYLCGDCGPFAASRSLMHAAAPHECPECGEPAPRTLASPHIRTSGARVRYIAESRNEKSAHEPATEHRLNGTTKKHREAHTHPHHGHSHGGHHGNQRPWMIGH